MENIEKIKKNIIDVIKDKNRVIIKLSKSDYTKALIKHSLINNSYFYTPNWS